MPTAKNATPSAIACSGVVVSRRNETNTASRTPMPFNDTGRISAANNTGPVSKISDSGTSRRSACTSIQIVESRAACTASANAHTAPSVPRWSRYSCSAS